MPWWNLQVPDIEVIGHSISAQLTEVDQESNAEQTSILAESSPTPPHSIESKPEVTNKDKEDTIPIVNTEASVSGMSNTETLYPEIRAKNNSAEFETRGRKLSIKKERSRSKSGMSRSITPFKIRDNMSAVFGWAVEGSDDDFEGNISKISLLRCNGIKQDSTSKLAFSKPCSKIAILNTEQNNALNFELSILKTKLGYFPSYYNWNAVMFKTDKSRIIKNIEYLHEADLLVKDIKEFTTYDKINITRHKFDPGRKGNVKGCSVDMKLFNGEMEHKSFCHLIKLIIDGNSLAQPNIHLSIIGMEFKRRKAKYSTFSIQLYPPVANFDKENVFDPNLILELMNCIRDNLPDPFQSIIDTSIIVNNYDFTTISLYQQ